jgi:riboflavin kinase/FMN adenylyltransferase
VSDTVAAVGYFDGVHVGHRRIIHEVVARAGKQGSRSLLLALEPHPREVLRAAGPPGRLTTVAEKRELIRMLGVREFIVLDFTRDTASRRAEEFLEDVMIDRFGVTCLVMGHDQRLGAGRQGDAHRLGKWGQVRGLEVVSVDAVTMQDDAGATVIVSSTAIRLALASGDVRWAAAMLGRSHSFVGTVVRGHGRGAREVGYATANLVPADPEKLLPAPGVYAVNVAIEGRMWPGALNLGQRPTFGGGPTSIEVHVPGLSGPLYGARLRVSFKAWLRKERHFGSPLELAEQIGRDIDAALQAGGRNTEEEQEEEPCPSTQT